MVWDASKLDDNTKLEVYKILKEVSSPMRNTELEFIVDKMGQIQKEKVIKEEIDVLYDFARYTKGASAFSQKTVDLLWTFSLQEQ